MLNSKSTGLENVSKEENLENEKVSDTKLIIYSNYYNLKVPGS
jgi:hypothetical protein